MWWTPLLLLACVNRSGFIHACAIKSCCVKGVWGWGFIYVGRFVVLGVPAARTLSWPHDAWHCLLKRERTKVTVKGGKPALQLGSTHGFGRWVIPFLSTEVGKKKPKIWQQSHGRVMCRWVNVLGMRSNKRWEWARTPRRRVDSGADPLRSRSRWWQSPWLGFHSRSWPGPSSFSHLPLLHTPASLNTEKTRHALPVIAFKINLNGREGGLNGCIKNIWNT